MLRWLPAIEAKVSTAEEAPVNGHDQPASAPVRTETVAVEPLKHPMGALTTYELRDYRHQLERAIAYFGKLAPLPRHGTGCKPHSMT